jgi:hypothetical protein
METPRPEGFALTRRWYDVTDPNADQAAPTFTVRSWNCLPGHNPAGGDRSAYRDACTIPDFGRDFTLTDANGDHPATTVAGWAAWEGLVPGTITLAGTVHPEETQPAVFCEKGGIPFDAPGGTITYDDLGPGQHISCDWFNATGSI